MLAKSAVPFALAALCAAWPSAAVVAAENDTVVAAATHYTVTALGDLGGGTVIPQAMDSAGRVAGFATLADSEFYHGFVTGPDGAGMTDICPKHPWACAAAAIADNGEIVGQYDAQMWADSTSFRARIDGSGFALLAQTPTSVTVSPYGVNARGQVVGVGTDASFHAVAFATGARDRHPTDLGALIPGGTSVARAINASGVVVGEADADDFHRRAFVRTRPGSAMRDLGSLTGNNSAATAVSDNGLVAGWSEVDIVEHHHAFVAALAGGAPTDLGTLGGTYSSATAVNSHGVVVGQSSLPDDHVYHAFVADATSGRMVDLNTVADLPAGVELINARALNERGQLVCSGFDARAYLLTPAR